MITKLDCLDTFESIKIGVAYKIDGKVLESHPAKVSDLDLVEVVYETFPGKCVYVCVCVCVCVYKRVCVCVCVIRNK